eukprot:Sspe_Gene.55283::Locus_30412_Transcript_1_1_Confidence_1.000_Length_971::g.55283::m.55283
MVGADDPPMLEVQVDGECVSCVACGLLSLEDLASHVPNSAAVTKLDVSQNSLSNIAGLEAFPKLTALILDNNTIESIENFPKLPNLLILWLNKNKITDLEHLLGVLRTRTPRLKYLSLLGNPVCKSELGGNTKDEAERYRIYTVYRLPSLELLDSAPVTATERKVAKERGSFLKVVKPRAEAQHKADTAAPAENKYYKDTPAREGQHATFLGYQKHQYTGKSSEGNRFIKDDQL